MKIKIIFILILLMQLHAKMHPLPYKPLLQKKITLNFVRATNERFPKMSEDQINIYLKEAQRVVKEHFGIRLTFKRQKDISVASLFKPFTLSLKEKLNQFICDFKNDNINKKRLFEDLHQTIQEYSMILELDEMIAFSKPYLIVDLKENSTQALAEALIDTEIYRLKKWVKIKAKDKHPVIDETPFNEWSYWDTLGYLHDEYDIILTNQLIASAEYYGQDMHSALRGGIVAGTTSYRKNSPYDAFVFMTSFLFVNDDLMIKKLRGNKSYGADEAAKYAGAYLAHEIGHMLLRLGHPFGNKSCVMSPSKMLQFDRWYRDINASKCSLKSDKSMTPGSVTLYYDDTLIN